jgi:hypothetical protein
MKKGRKKGQQNGYSSIRDVKAELKKGQENTHHILQVRWDGCLWIIAVVGVRI